MISISPVAVVVILYSTLLLTLTPTLVTCSNNGKTPNLDEPFQNSFFHKLPQTPCVSLFTRDTRIGCGTTDRDTSKGTLFHWSTLVETIESYSSLPSFVAVLDEGEYTSDVVGEIMASGTSIKGILVLSNTTAAAEAAAGGDASLFTSPAPPYPRGADTPSSGLNPGYDYAWNPNGDALMLANLYGVPTGYVLDDPDMAVYLQGVAREQSAAWIGGTATAAAGGYMYGAGGILESAKGIVAEFTLYMGQDGITTPECLAWVTKEGGEWQPQCLPLGGNSVWALAGSPYKYDDQYRGDYNNNNNNNANNERKRKRTLEDEDKEYDDGEGGGDDDADADANEKQGIVMVATNMDSSSMFHDVAPGANTAASNILSVLMAAKLIGESVSDATLDTLNKKIMFAIFQAETYGFMGSRSFLKDVISGFTCDDGLQVPANAGSKTTDDGTNSKQKMACLNPFRYDMDFTQLGSIDSMIVVDQIGVPTTDGSLYVHSDNADGGTLSTILTGLSSDDWTIAQGSAGSIPPTPLSTLLQLTGGATGGAVLAGYDDAFGEGYLSHLDSNATRPVDMDAIAFAATALARAALMAASSDGGGSYYDAEGAIGDLDPEDGDLVELADCLLADGTCDLLARYTDTEGRNRKKEVGFELGFGPAALGKPPSYYTSVFNINSGQGFAKVNDRLYGSYTGDQYGSDSDAVTVVPSILEMGIHALLDDYLGRGSADTNDNGDDDNSVELKSCTDSGDCADISYCASANGDRAVCSGTKVCVCSRARYHMALDEAVYPAPNNSTSFFLVVDGDGDEGVSAMYSEPTWSFEIGVDVFRDTDRGSGNWMLVFGFAAAAGWVGLTVWVKRKLVDAKLY